MILKNKFMLRAIELSISSANGSGGPFGSVIVKDEKIIAEGSNKVTFSNDPTAHAEIVAKTPSKDIIIAAGAASIFLWPKSCRTKATPPDKIPAYNISKVSSLIFEMSISSNIVTNKKDSDATTKFCINEIKKGKSNFWIILPI